MKTMMKYAAGAAFALGAMTTAASAAGNILPATAQPGETAGLAMGAPLPEGVYFVNTLDWGVRKVKGEDFKLGVTIPVIAWSTPWSILGANFQLLAATPMAHLDAPGAAADNYGFYNPFVAAKLAYDLGGGFGVSYLSGIYFNAGAKGIAKEVTTWRQDFAVSYTGDGLNLTANLIWGLTFDADKNAPDGQRSDGFNLDLTATKTFGKWEVGAVGVGFYEYNLKGLNKGTGKSKSFAVGPLLGYNFGPVILQAYGTYEVYNRNILTPGGTRNRDARFWTRIIIPLWTPATPAAPLVTKY